MNRFLTRISAVTVATAAVAVATPALASAATTYCVHQSSSTCAAGTVDVGSDLAAALSAAQNAPATASAPNVIRIGPGVFAPSGNEELHYQSSNPLDVVGAGQGVTTVEGGGLGSPALELGSPTTTYAAVTVSDVTIMPAANAQVVLELVGATADHVTVSAGGDATGVELSVGRLTSSTVSLSGANGLGVQTDPVSGSDDNDVADSTVSAGVGILIRGLSEVHRTTVSAQQTAVQADGAPGYVDDSLLLTTCDGVTADSDNGEGSINALNDTVIHTGGQPGDGIRSANDTGDGADIQVLNSIIRGFHYAFITDQNQSGTATIEAAHDDFDGEVLGSNISDSDPTTADPAFVEAANGNYHLSAASPLIDASAQQDLGSVSSTTDLDGNPRVVTIDNAATPIDLGAYEDQPPVQTGTTTTTATTPPTTTPTPTTTAPTTITGPTTTTTTPSTGTTLPPAPSHPGTSAHPTTTAHVATLALLRAPHRHGTAIRMTLGCTGAGACTAIHVSVRLAGHTVASKTVRIAVGHRRTVVLSLNRAARRALAHRHHGRFSVLISYLRSNRRTKLHPRYTS